MGRPKKHIRAATEESATPPDSLGPHQTLARVLTVEGSSVFACQLADGSRISAELALRFRNAVWVRRGGYVLLKIPPEAGTLSAHTAALHDGETPEAQQGVIISSRDMAEIINVVRDEKEWRKASFWPTEFAKTLQGVGNQQEDDEVTGMLPPSDSESDGV